MSEPERQDPLFRDAVAATDAGDLSALAAILTTHPSLVRDRLEQPGAWLRDQVGNALDGFFQRPYLLWFVAEDPVRNGKLPSNIAAVARLIIEAARKEGVATLQEQLDYALTLVSLSWIARDCGVQVALLDELLDAGAVPDGNPDWACINRNWSAAEHLLARGAPLTLGSALCLGRWDDIPRLVAAATERERRFALVLVALHGNAEALRRMVAFGADVNAASEDLYSHGTPLHHAACSGSLEAVQILVKAGANQSAIDKAWSGTPLGWAEHAAGSAKTERERERHRQVADYLRSKQDGA